MNTQTLHAGSADGASLGRVLGASIVTGQVAALIMAAVVMAVFTLFLGKGPLYPVQVIGSVVFGAPALVGFNAGAFVTGLVVHMLVAVPWSIVFALLLLALQARSPAQTAAAGVAMAVLSMSDSYIFVPHVMMALHGVDFWNREVPMAWNWAAHMVFGLSFALYPAILGKITGYGRA